ncbi:MAG: hypothetical protein ACR2PJ_00615 [Pseudomonadales bacterium]
MKLMTSIKSLGISALFLILVGSLSGCWWGLCSEDEYYSWEMGGCYPTNPYPG